MEHAVGILILAFSLFLCGLALDAVRHSRKHAQPRTPKYRPLK